MVKKAEQQKGTTSLEKKLTKPDSKIIATWSKKEVSIITKWLDDKIAVYQDKDFKELSQDLIAIQRFIGITEIPPASSRFAKMIMDYIDEHFSDFAASEIEYAFQLAMSQSLPGLTDNSHYQSFDAKYIGKILNLYRKFRGELVLKYRQGEYNLTSTKAQEKAEQSIPAKDESLKKLSFMTWEGFKTSAPAYTAHTRVYDHLVEKGVINHTPQVIAELTSAAVVNLKTSGTRGTVKQIRKIIETGTPIETPLEVQVQCEMKRLALNKFFSDLHRMKGELSDYYPEQPLELKTDEKK